MVALSVFPLIVHFFTTSFRKGQNFKLCVISRIRDVSLLLPQWLEFHIAAGVDHFFLTNDCSNDATLQWLTIPLYSASISLSRNQSFNNCTQGANSKEGDLIDDTFQRAKAACEWTVLLDPDEYIFPTHFQPGALVSDYIANLSVPLLRLPWLVMSNNGYEKSVDGMTIVETFRSGSIFNKLKKTLVQSRYIKRWINPHHPEKFEYFSPKIGPYPLRDVSRPFYISDNEMETNGRCTIPKAPLYIRHFQTQAWHDFLVLRSNRRSPWFSGSEDDLRRIWRESNLQSSCLPPGDEFVSFIVSRMKNRLRDHSPSKFESFYKDWLKGTALTLDTSKRRRLLAADDSARALPTLV